MAELTFDIRYDEQRSRLTNAFRGILSIPLVIVLYFWSLFAGILAFVQWFIVLFTGKRNQALWDLEYDYLGFAGRVNGYSNLMFDPYPPFGTAQGATPAVLALQYEETGSRLTNGLRFIWAIPALIILWVLSIAFGVVVIISWFAIVITAKHPRGLFDFSLNVLRYTLQANAYLLLMTDTYPKWGSGVGAPAPVPGSPLPPPGR
ncbi:MAG: DUF4389 domain-containing protein [Ilumatobacteraceae bacterium]